MRLRITSAVLLAVLLGAVTTGCGKKSRPVDGEMAEVPPPVVPLTTTPPVKNVVVPPRATPPVEPTPALPDPTPAFPAPELPVPPAAPPVTTPAPPKLDPVAQLPVIPPPNPNPQPPAPKDPPKTPPEPKDMPTKLKDPEWPREINGRDVTSFLKDCLDPDPAVREIGLRTIPNFGPTARKVQDKDGRNLFGKTVLLRMNNLKEGDSGVRAAAYSTAAIMGFEDDADNREAVRILANAVEVGVPGGSARQHAVQALAAFGPKAEAAVATLTGEPVRDTAYETRRSIAFALGKIGFNDSTGPNAKALTCLTVQLAADASAMVRMEALQSLALLGPPWGVVRAAGDKTPPKLDEKGVAAHVGALKKRLAPAPVRPGEKGPAGLVEKDKQVEAWVRLVVMRFDTKEVNDENLTAIAKMISGPDQGSRLQAITILGMMGEIGARRIDDIVKALDDADPLVVQTAVTALGTLGANAKPAVPALRKLLAHKDEGVKKLAAEAIKFITDPPKSPANDPPPPKK